jgi:hypothetical protein
MAVYRKLTLKRREKFLHMLAATGHVTQSAAIADLSRVFLYQMKRQDEAFSKAWDEAEQIGTKALEDEALRRAAQGFDEPVFYQGVQCGVVRKYSDTLLTFLLKARDPAKYRERISTEISGPEGGPLQQINTVTNDPVEAAQIYQRIMRGEN